MRRSQSADPNTYTYDEYSREFQKADAQMNMSIGAHGTRLDDINNLDWRKAGGMNGPDSIGGYGGRYTGYGTKTGKF